VQIWIHSEILVLPVQVKSVPFDPRFPTTNQARNCYTRYNEFYRCKEQKSEDDAECKFYQKAYRSLCPGKQQLVLGLSVLSGRLFKSNGAALILLLVDYLCGGRGT